MIGVKTNLVDLVWGDTRPPRPQESIRTLALHFAGKKFEEKIEDLRKELEKKKSAGFIVCKMSFGPLICEGLLMACFKRCWMRLLGYIIYEAMSMPLTQQLLSNREIDGVIAFLTTRSSSHMPSSRLQQLVFT